MRRLRDTLIFAVTIVAVIAPAVGVGLATGAAVLATPETAEASPQGVIVDCAKDGKLDNPGFLDYRMPVTSDLPKIDAVMIEVPNPKHPQGVRGVGEVPLVPVMSAVANAIHNATKLRLYSLPMSPPKVLEALEPEPLARAAD